MLGQSLVVQTWSPPFVFLDDSDEVRVSHAIRCMEVKVMLSYAMFTLRVHLSSCQGFSHLGAPIGGVMFFPLPTV